MDLRDYEATHQLVADLRPQLIYHLAGRVTAQRDSSLILPMLEDNLVGTVHLLLAAAEAGCSRFVHTGSSEEAHGAGSDGTASSPYAASKAAASAYASMFHRLCGVPVAILRPFAVYGPRQQRDKLIPYSIVSLLHGESPQLSGGEQVRDFIYVLDVVDGLLMAGVEPRAVGETIDLGSGAGKPVREVVDLIAELTEASVSAAFGALTDRAGEGDQVANPEKAKRLLGWEPRWSLRQGLALTVDWYRAHNADKARVSAGETDGS